MIFQLPSPFEGSSPKLQISEHPKYPALEKPGLIFSRFFLRADQCLLAIPKNQTGCDERIGKECVLSYWPDSLCNSARVSCLCPLPYHSMTWPATIPRSSWKHLDNSRIKETLTASGRANGSYQPKGIEKKRIPKQRRLPNFLWLVNCPRQSSLTIAGRSS